MQIILTAVEHGLADAWRRFCGDLPFVQVHEGSIFDVACDAVVSPANSFGFMDGGIDMLYSRIFGWDVEKRLQTAIRERHFGELPVGAAEIVETGHAAIPYLIAAPTMRVPMVLKESVSPYLAARAVLILARDGTLPDGRPVADAVQTVAFPGLGTGVGRVGPNTCAVQMRAAIDAVLLGATPFPRSWGRGRKRAPRPFRRASPRHAARLVIVDGVAA